jgi:hypothetical protein
MTLPARIAIVNGLADAGREPALQLEKLGAGHSGDPSLFSEINAMCGFAISSYSSSRRVQFDPSPKNCLRILSGKRRCPIIELECPLTSSFL